MEFDDEDPSWLEACMAAVDSLPVANLRSTSKASPSDSSTSDTSLHRNNNGNSSTTTTTMTPRHRHGGRSVSTPSSLLSYSSPAPLRAGSSSTSAVSQRTAPPSPPSRGAVESGGYGSTSRTRQQQSRGSWTKGRGRRLQGVGAYPDDDVRHIEEQGQPDPCWRCGEAVNLVDYGSGSFYSCSSRPLCNAKRPTLKNGAVVELVAEEMFTNANNSAASRAGSPSSSVPERAEQGGITRCHLAVTVRGGHNGGAAEATWDMLGKHGIVPERQTDGGGSTRQSKALLEMGKRNSVRGLVKQAGIAYRDVPQTTYGRLMASGAGTPASGGKMVKSAGRPLEPLDVCQGLMYMLPDGLRETLLPFQRDGVLYGLRRKGRCLIADEMGTGKTLQALGVMGCYKEDWPLLIVAPASMRLMWAEEVEHWFPFLAPSDIHLIKGNKDKLYLTNLNRYLWPRVVIVSYFMLRMLAESIGRDNWKAVIFDESHMISTKLGDERLQAQQVSVCVDVAKRAKRVVMVSGTPALSKPFEIFNQVEALSPGLLGQGPLYKAKHNFASNYCGGSMRGQTRNGTRSRVPFISGSYYPDELHLLLKNEVMIRRLKRNVIDQLPPLRRIVVRVMEHTEDLKRALNAGGFEPDGEGDEEEEEGGGKGRRAGGMSGDQRAGLKKVKSASEWVVDKLAASQETLTKFVVFAHHRTVLDRLQEAFELAGYHREVAGEGGDGKGFACLRIDGEVPTALRASRLLEFNTQERCRVLLVSITAGGQGLDFTAASNVVFVELPESPAWLRQAEDRLHRRRQEKSVNVYLTVLPPGSHDDTRWLSLSEKLTTQTSVMNGTARAENIDVHKVYDVGGIMGMGEETQSQPSNRGRDRLGAGLNIDSDASDAGDSHASDDDGDICGSLSFVEDTEFDAELRAALRTTPVDLPAYTKSQSPTLRLLRAIADSPAPRRKDARTPAEARNFRRAVGVRDTPARLGGSGNKRSPTGNRASLRPSRTPRERRMMPATTPGSGRKRPRPSPGSGDSTKSSTNPFRAFHHRSLPPPQPSPPPPPGRAASLRKADPGIKEISAGGSTGGGSVDMGDVGKVAGAGKAESDVREISAGVSMEVDGVDIGDDFDDFVLPGMAAGKVLRAPQASQEGDDGGSPSVALVDLSELDENGEPSARGTARLQETEPINRKLGLSQEARGGGARVGVDVASPTPSWRGKAQDEDGKGGEMAGGGKEEEEARRLFFLVSANTGRVHVYKQAEGDAGGLDDSFDEEQGRPQHCRCNFRPEELDRLFEAAKGAWAPSSEPEGSDACEVVAREALQMLPELVRSAPALRVHDTDCHRGLEETTAVQVTVVPSRVEDFVAMVARRFVQEWRALSNRKRPLLKGMPCRPPLLKQLAKVTPGLTGSTRRYAEPGPANGGGGGRNATIENRHQESGQVMCLFCLEEPASEQGQAAHRRDRFCSIKCMEAHASRSSGGSLRRLVLERDQGVCSEEGCGRDCLALVSRLRAVQDLQKRRDILLGADPRFRDDRNHKLMERLARQPTDGYAWNADHVTAVYQGGGECGVENLRTLCVICHAEVTRKQTAERAAAKRISKENARRSLEEARGQRRLVSFGGEITLSGASQGSETSPDGVGRRRRGSRPDDDCELDSDASDDVVFMPSPSTVPPASGARARGRRSAANRGSGHDQQDVGGGPVGSRSMVRPSLEAFERLISGEDFCVDSPPAPSVAAGGSKSDASATAATAATPGGGNGNGDAVKALHGSMGQGDGSGSSSDDTCEITFTRVRRIPRPSSGSGASTAFVGNGGGGEGSGVVNRRASFDYLVDSPCASDSDGTSDQ